MAADDESHLLAAEVSGWVWTWIEAVMYPCIVLASLKPIRTAIRPARKTGPGTGRRKDGGKAVGSGRPLGILILSA